LVIIFKSIVNLVWWFMIVIPACWDVVVGGSEDHSWPGQKREILSEKQMKEKKKRMGHGSSKCEVLHSIPTTSTSRKKIKNNK
jgi:hypothetical protein